MSQPAAELPLLHLSLPVHDLDAALAFYVDVLGCPPGRRRAGWADVDFFGCQLTLQERPDEVLPSPGTRHFGVTLARADWDRLVERLSTADVRWLSEPTTSYAGTDREQAKAMLADPSGNAVELKTYADLDAALRD